MINSQKLRPYLFVAIGLIVLSTLSAVWLKLNQPPTSDTPPESGSEAHLPEDFALRFDWGVCQNEAERTVITLGPDGRGSILWLKEGLTSGQESTLVLSPEQQTRLITLIRENQIMALPSEITAGEGQISLSPGCSRLQLTMDGETKTIDEADGLEPRYYRLKLFMEQLT